MAEIVYILCALTSLACSFLLIRAYRATRTRLLLWSSLGFTLFALNNILLFVDLVLTPPEMDLTLIRSIPVFFGCILFLHGLIWESA